LGEVLTKISKATGGEVPLSTPSRPKSGIA
jgi:hypothetical protein